MNITMIAGTVGRDAELRNTQGGDAVLSFSVAVDNGKDKNGNKREATWFDCSIWGKRAQSLSSYITKGTKIALSGAVSTREHNGKAYLQLRVNDLTFQGSGSSMPAQEASHQSMPVSSASGYDDMNDSIPF
jgi:single-strand DNA-binding protein